jgi:hypothetical protein
MPLNLPNEGNQFEAYLGRNIDKMPELLRAGKVPITNKAKMVRTLNIVGSTPKSNLTELQKAYLYNYFDTGDCILYPGNEDQSKFKIERNSQLARALTSQVEMKDGAYVLLDGFYENPEGEEIQRSQVITGKYLTKQQVLDSPVWNVLADHDQNLLGHYFDLVSRITGQPENMAVWLANAQNKPTMRLWCVDRFDLDYRSGAYGNTDLDNAYGWLLGVASEVLSALEEGTYIPLLEQRVSDASSVMERPAVELNRENVGAYLSMSNDANDLVLQYIRTHPEILRNPNISNLVQNLPPSNAQRQSQTPRTQTTVSQKSADELKREKEEQERVKKLGRFGFIEMD